jgi:hypothetical protein
VNSVAADKSPTPSPPMVFSNDFRHITHASLW